MLCPTDRPDGNVADAVGALLTAHQHLGDEALALAKAAAGETGAARAGALRRAHNALVEGATRLVGIIESFFVLHAMEQLGVDGSPCRTADGRTITNLPGLDDQEARLTSVLFVLNSLVEHFDTKVFPVPKPNRCSTVPLARSPYRTGIALLALRDAVLATGQAAAERGLTDEAEKCTGLAAAIEQLETRVCSRPAPPLTADQVVAAVQADPVFAEAVSRALSATATVG